MYQRLRENGKEDYGENTFNNIDFCNDHFFLQFSFRDTIK